MTDLAAWLLAQITDDERIANAASMEEVPDFWQHQLDKRDPYAVHVAQHGPAQVLADCATKRRLIELAAADLEQGSDDEGPLTSGARLATDVLRLLALPYADRTGYDRQWRP